MHYLAAFVVDVLLAWIASKAARIAVLVGISVVLLGGLWITLNAMLNGLNVFFTQSGMWYNFWMGVSFFIPSNFSACITLMFGADLAVFVYRFYARTVELGAS
jgi:hypothetical protein